MPESPLSFLNASVENEAAQLTHRFVNAQPFRHAVIENFFDAAFAESLLAAFPAFDRGNRVGDDGREGGKSTVERIMALGPAFRALDACIQTPDFLRLIGTIAGIDDLMYDPFYLGGGTHENRHGQALQAHVDFNYHPSERWHRRLNLIVYLNPEWNESWGGNLELWRDPYQDANPVVRIAPAMNRCVIFETTESSWHGFDKIALPPERADLSRKSIALYFYSRQRPAQETAGKHTTHYVNRQLPGHLVAGHTLTHMDIETLRELIAHRDNQMQRLYAENASLLQARDRGISGQILYQLRRLYVRYLR
jgi:Rps23 Pro-64 3,4-dihydroxylase Tpa1-like proline 4-hydroxylase